MRRPALLIVSVLALCFGEHKATAQFYKPIVRLMGTVTLKDGKPVVAKVSVRDAADTTKEIGNSTSNSATAKYLVILQPEKNYLIVVRGDSLVSQSVKITTPATDHNTEVIQNFTMQFVQPAHNKPAKAAKAPKKKATKKKKK